MDARLDESVAKRRKVRKGTHSCWECRRRKVKCTLSSPRDVICIMCRRRGTECVSQDVVGQEILGRSDVVEDGLNRIGTVETFLDKPTEKDGSNVQTILHNAAVGPAVTSECSMSTAPPFALHRSSSECIENNTHRTTIEPTPVPITRLELPQMPALSRAPIAELNRHQKATQALLNSFPSRSDIEILLQKTTSISTLCYQSNLKSRSLMRKKLPNDPIRLANLMYPETHPVLLARQMLLLAAALQYLSPTEVIPGLKEHHHVIMERLVESVTSVVTTNDRLVGTIESLEAIVLEGFFHIDSGNIRRAWIAMRRGVMVAHLLGVHRSGQYRFKVINDGSDIDPKVLWQCIVSMERMLSLLLGLPSSTTAMSSNPDIPQPDSGEEIELSTLAMGITAKIIERNESRQCQQALDLTREIDHELVHMTEQLPSNFWRPPSFVGLEIDSESAFWETRRTWDQMCYYTMVNQLHLPFMMCESLHEQSIYSKVACVNACREILTREITFRTFNPITACCRMGDFISLIAGMTLMLAYIVSHCDKETDQLLTHQRLTDRGTVEQALECMKSMSELRDDVLTAKCAALLKHLLAIEADAAEGQRYRKLRCTEGDYQDDRNVLVINLPYVGAIRITREGITSMAPLKRTQDQCSREGITIGGIGSVHVDSPRPPSRSDYENASNITQGQTTTQAFGRTSDQQTETRSSQLASEDLIAQHDQLIPDAAAGIDDWAFQGFDTAFFELLMNRPADQPLNTFSTEGWDFGASS